jgi:hypothetical protein
MQELADGVSALALGGSSHDSLPPCWLHEGRVGVVLSFLHYYLPVHNGCKLFTYRFPGALAVS